MSRRSIDLLLADIEESVGKINNYTDGLDLDQFKGDEKTIDAVVRNLEIIGEAANRLPDEFRLKNNQIDWSGVIGLRHRIVHDYFGIDIEIIWHILQADLPELKHQLEAIRNSG